MTDAAKNDLPVEACIPTPGVPLAPLASILCTEELARRSSRPPDYEKENRALAALAGALVDSRANILQILADTILDVTEAGSSGLSLLTKDDDGKRFYWPAIAGEWRGHVGGGTPRDFGPCGDVLDQNRTLLFRHFERRYPYLLPVIPVAEECLLVPFYVAGKAVGTIWAMAHGNHRKFDAEDERIMSTLGQFASLAYQTLESIEELKSEVAAREKAEVTLRELANGLEAKVRRLVDANIMGIFIWKNDGTIVDANEAFLQLVEYDRGDLVSGHVSWRDLTPIEWRDADDRRVAELMATGIAQPYEKEYIKKSGSRVSVLVGAALFEDNGDEGVGFVVDLTERKRAEVAARDSERRYREVEMELAHANRVAAMGQLSASIGHEVNQPIAAAVTNARAALRWLSAESPDLEEVRQALGRIVKNGVHASDIIGRIHAFLKKIPAQKDLLKINDAVLEVTALTRGELTKSGVSVRTQLGVGLPLIQADRVQLQQVILNLIINAIEAMSGPGDRSRELLIRTEKTDSDDVLIAVQDSGPGLPRDNPQRAFEPFYTTKTGGLGMGLAICRSIIEGHGGRLWATASVPQGATFMFTLPAHPHEAVQLVAHRLRQGNFRDRVSALEVMDRSGASAHQLEQTAPLVADER
jgi:PAS domain S-box-containing protein